MKQNYKNLIVWQKAIAMVTRIYEVTKGFPPFHTYASLSPLVMILWLTVFSSMRVYEARRMLRRTHEVHLILRAHCMAMLFFIALTYMFSDTGYNLIRIISNMLWLWAFGFILQEMTGNDKLIPIYIYGGVFGGIVFIAANYFNH